MSQVQFILTDNNPDIQSAISEFVQDEFGQEVNIQTVDNSTDSAKKDFGTVLDLLGTAVSNSWMIMGALGTVNGVISFSERINRLERVQKLKKALQGHQQPIYLQIGEQEPVDISQKSVDEIITILEKINKLEKNK